MPGRLSGGPDSGGSSAQCKTDTGACVRCGEGDEEDVGVGGLHHAAPTLFASSSTVEFFAVPGNR